MDHPEDLAKVLLWSEKAVTRWELAIKNNTVINGKALSYLPHKAVEGQLQHPRTSPSFSLSSFVRVIVIPPLPNCEASLRVLKPLRELFSLFFCIFSACVYVMHIVGTQSMFADVNNVGRWEI